MIISSFLFSCPFAFYYSKKHAKVAIVRTDFEDVK